MLAARGGCRAGRRSDVVVGPAKMDGRGRRLALRTRPEIAALALGQTAKPRCRPAQRPLPKQSRSAAGATAPLRWKRRRSGGPNRGWRLNSPVQDRCASFLTATMAEVEPFLK